MKKNIPQLLSSLAIVLFLVGCTPKSEKAIGIDLSLMDTTVRPQDDFYNYVNGTWMKNAEIPDDRTRWGSFDELREKTDADVLELLKKASSKEQDETSDEGKAVLLYKLITDTVARDADGINPLKPFLNQIDEIASLEDVQNYLIKTQPYGSGGIFGFYVSSDAKDSNKNAPHIYAGPLGIERDYYVKDDEDSKKVKVQYETHVARMFGFLGSDETEAAALAATVVAMETQMAAARLDKVERRDPAKRYNPTAMKGLQSMVSSVKWDAYFKGIGAEGLDEIIVTDLGYFTALNDLLENNSIADWKAYLKWTLVDQAASELTTEMETANWDFYSKTLRGAKAQRPLEKRALSRVNRNLGQPLGKLYVAEKFPPIAKEQMKELVGNLIKAYTARINNLEWMDASTKEKAIEKLEKTTVKVGYPDQWEDYSALTLNDADGTVSYFGAMLNIARFNFN